VPEWTGRQALPSFIFLVLLISSLKRFSPEPVNCYFYAGKILWVDSRDIPDRLIIIVNLFCISMNEFFCSRSLNVSG
jgi:hypothetical protein